MQTVAVDLVDTEWVDILAGNNTLAVQIVTANKIRMHFSNSDTPPAIDAPSVLIDSFPPRWDFECQSQTGQSHVWARADVSPAKVIVVRRTV